MSEHGTFVWNELATTDPKAAGDFYTRLLDWTRHDEDAGPFGVYTLFRRDGKDVAGMMEPRPDERGARSSAWHAYVAVDDVDATVARVPALGGRVVVPPHDVADVGRMCMIADPTGAVIVLMTPVAAPAATGDATRSGA